jgi:hypothetical protein
MKMTMTMTMAFEIHFCGSESHSGRQRMKEKENGTNQSISSLQLATQNKPAEEFGQPDRVVKLGIPSPIFDRSLRETERFGCFCF